VPAGSCENLVADLGLKATDTQKDIGNSSKVFFLRSLFGVTSEFAFVCWEPCKHNLVLGHTGLLEIGGDAIFSAITVNPKFLIPQFNIHHRAVNPFDAIPTDGQEQVTSMFAVENGLALQITVRVRDAGIGTQELNLRSEFQNPI
jgi:hypothetical protein